MTNKKILLTSTAIAGLLFSTTSFAQTTKFVGPSFAITGSHVASSTQSNINTDSLSDYTDSNVYLSSTEKNSQVSKLLGIDLGYGFNIGTNFVLGVGATYDFGKIKTGSTYNYTDNDANEDATSYLAKSSLKNHRSIYIQPTYVVNKESALFAKVGRHFAKSENDITYCQSDSYGEVDFGCVDGNETQYKHSKNVSGWGYGLGLKTFLTENLFMQVEGSVVNYSKNDLLSEDNELVYYGTKARTSNATISVGYKF
jgi:opacity protein-like surface antigen